MKENAISDFFALVKAGLWEEECMLSTFDNIDSLRFFPYIIYNGLRSVVKGELN